MNLGIVLATRGKHQEALQCYNKALKYRKNYATCYYNMGNLVSWYYYNTYNIFYLFNSIKICQYIDINESELALQFWKEALTINPKHKKAWANILAYLDNNGEIYEVIRMSTIALNYIPNDPAILFTRANSYGKLGRFKDAENVYKEIILLKPDNALYHVNLGVLYHRWNRRKSAVASYKNALAIDPNNKSAKKNLLKLTSL